VSALVAAPVLADEEVHQPVDIGVFAGVHIFPSDSSLGRFSTDPDSLSPQTGPAFGLRFGYAPISRLELEVEGLIIPTHSGDTPRGKTHILVWAVRGHLMFYLIDRGPFRLFVLGGWGALASSPSDKNIVPSDTDDPIHFGAGAKIAFSQHIGLRIDGRVL